MGRHLLTVAFFHEKLQDQAAAMTSNALLRQSPPATIVLNRGGKTTSQVHPVPQGSSRVEFP